MSRFKQGLLSKRDFVVTCELVPGRGYTGSSIDSILRFAEEARGSRYVYGLSLTDHAGGNPALCADILGPEIQRIGPDLMVHFSCKDMNRNMIEARAFALKGVGVTNLLVITGDYPISGAFGLPKPVFDIDSVVALHYLRQMNEGLEYRSGRQRLKTEATDFFLGAVASPFKATEASACLQYVKLEKKVRSGAHFLVTQLGYDSRKFAEFIAYVRRVLELDLPVMGSVYVLYNGAHVEGLNLKYEDVNTIMERSEQIGGNWRDYVEEFDFSPPQAFFMFRGGEDFSMVENGQGLEAAVTRRRKIVSPKFWLMRLAHRLLFIEGTPGYRLMRVLAESIENRRFFYRLFQTLEHVVKRSLFDCRECDDCALFETYYLCPESRCPKGQRLGPCGGSRVEGGCEVFADRPCLRELVYWRAKNRGELARLRYIINPRGWKLSETSSWVNYFLKKDHSGNNLQAAEPR